MSLAVKDKKFLGYVSNLISELEGCPFEVSQSVKDLIGDLKRILILKEITLVSLSNIVPFFLEMFQFSYDFHNDKNSKRKYNECKYIFSYINKNFIIKREYGLISIRRNFNKTSEVA